MAAQVYLGTSGFSYKYWQGRFYPKGLSPRDQLDHYARRFNAVEINSTYYGIPPASQFERMRDKTPPPFAYVVKAFQGITHAPGVDEAACRQFSQCLEPLRASGQLSLVLLQFPNAFRPVPDSLEKLKRLREAFADDRLVVEFRHTDWVRRVHLELLKGLEVAWCNVDEPQLPGLVPRLVAATNGDGYVRFHGRNAGAWYGDERDQRYNYLYRRRELVSWLAGMTQLAAVTQRLFVFMNNCYLGHAAKNAMLLQELMRQMELLEGR